MENQDNPEIEQSEAMLTDIEARALGCLMEKQLTTPDVYPLSLNSLVTACNQKTSREPVMTLNNGEVQRCINQLHENGLVEIEYGSRADKYDQRLNRKLHFDKADQAIFCLLLLRGPQTLNELFSRSRRMFDFTNTDQIKDITEVQLAKLKPLLMIIPAQSGQREDRYMHLLCGEPDLSALPLPSTRKSTPVDNNAIQALTERVDALEKQMTLLMDKFEH